MNRETGNPQLNEFIRKKIAGDGPQSFDWFMEQALYHPEQGFYSSGRGEIGRHGHYFSNVSVGPLFGELLAAQFAEIWNAMGRPAHFAIVEQGAHNGDFARDILIAAASRHPEFSAVLRYQIVEPFAVLVARQAQTLADFKDRASWSCSLEELKPFVGIHFSNELLDSFPVRLVVATVNGWREKKVGLDRDEFVFVESPIDNPELTSALDRSPEFPVGSELEVNLAAGCWMETLAKKIERGCIVIIDYGLTRGELQNRAQGGGTLQAVSRHRRLDSPLQFVGDADLTAHVNWTSLAERARQHGLDAYGFTDQHHFLTGIISDLAQLPEQGKTMRQLQTLLHPEMLGRAFQVLLLQKDTRLGKLAGFRFAGDAAAALGL